MDKEPFGCLVLKLSRRLLEQKSPHQKYMKEAGSELQYFLTVTTDCGQRGASIADDRKMPMTVTQIQPDIRTH